MTDLYLAVALAEVALMIPLLFRLAAGPTVSDRIVALNTVSTQAALAVLFFAAMRSEMPHPATAGRRDDSRRSRSQAMAAGWN